MKKVRCINDEEHFHFKLTIGKIYEVKKESAIDYLLVDDNGLEWYPVKSRFEEVKEDKIQLSLRGSSISRDNKNYTIINYGTAYKLNVLNNTGLQHEIRWGVWGSYNEPFENVKPLLDALNIEIIEEPKKYKIVQQEYAEEEVAKLREAGLKFEEVK